MDLQFLVICILIKTTISQELDNNTTKLPTAKPSQMRHPIDNNYYLTPSLSQFISPLATFNPQNPNTQSRIPPHVTNPPLFSFKPNLPNGPQIGPHFTSKPPSGFQHPQNPSEPQNPDLDHRFPPVNTSGRIGFLPINAPQ